MTAEELKMKFDELYMYMATSKNPQNMMVDNELTIEGASKNRRYSLK